MATIGKHGRRMFLRGAGGFTLALPLLPSLVGDRVAAQAHQQKRFIAIGTEHGGVPAAQMFPADAVATEQETLFPGHVGRHGAVPYEIDRGTARISPVLSAPEGALTPTLASKINVVRGLGMMRAMGHHKAGQLGNFDEGGGEGRGATLDQALAWSDRFYPKLDQVTQRSIHVAADRRSQFTWGYSNPRTRSGELAAIPSETSSVALFDSIFGSAEPAEPGTARRTVVDRVYQHYRAMSTGRFEDAERLSSDDRRRLSDHMDRMQELQRRLEARRGVASCGGAGRPMVSAGFGRNQLELTAAPVDEARNAQWYALFNDVIVAAFVCGASSVATIHVSNPMVDGWSAGSTSDWHERVAHGGDTERLAAQVNSAFRNVFLDLAAKLDVPEEGGRTYLDNSLIQQTQEAGFLTHFAFEIPLVTAGSAGGYFETGRFVDYRYRESLRLPLQRWINKANRKAEFREGLTYNRYLANVAFAMGLGPDELEYPETPGFGAIIVGDEHREAYHAGILAAASDPLPFLTRG